MFNKRLTELQQSSTVTELNSITYTSQTRDQQHFTISEVAADWHELLVPQAKFLTSECTNWWRFKSVAVQKHFGHSLQTYGFTPSCRHTCILKSRLKLNFFWQMLQLSRVLLITRVSQLPEEFQFCCIPVRSSVAVYITLCLHCVTPVDVASVG